MYSKLFNTLSYLQLHTCRWKDTGPQTNNHNWPLLSSINRGNKYAARPKPITSPNDVLISCQTINFPKSLNLQNLGSQCISCSLTITKVYFFHLSDAIILSNKLVNHKSILSLALLSLSLPHFQPDKTFNSVISILNLKEFSFPKKKKIHYG